jgi:hypothetical protein
VGIVAKQSGATRKPVPAGNYFGVCVGVYDIGTHSGGKFGPKYQVVLQWELHKKKGVCRNDEGDPLRISSFYNLAFGEKSTLRKHVEAILGRSFTEQEAKDGYDVTKLLDKACRLTVAHEDTENGVRDQISAFMTLDEDDPQIKPVSDSVVYEMDPKKAIPDEVPEWIQKKVQESQEWVAANGKSVSTKAGSVKAGNGKKAAAPDDDDEEEDIPF